MSEHNPYPSSVLYSEEDGIYYNPVTFSREDTPSPTMEDSPSIYFDHLGSSITRAANFVEMRLNSLTNYIDSNLEMLGGDPDAVNAALESLQGAASMKRGQDVAMQAVMDLRAAADAAKEWE